MPMTFYRRLMNLRCPECDAVQPTFPLRATFRAGLQRFALNDYAVCPTCRAHLRLVSRFEGGETFLIQLALAGFGLAVFLFGFVPLVGVILSTFGIWGVAVLALLFISFPYLVAAFMGRIGPHIRRVVKV